jgi:hypothetical protein
MAFAYIPPPDEHEFVYKVAEWISRFYRCKVTIAIEHFDGYGSTVVIGHPDKPSNAEIRG